MYAARINLSRWAFWVGAAYGDLTRPVVEPPGGSIYVRGPLDHDQGCQGFMTTHRATTAAECTCRPPTGETPPP